MRPVELTHPPDFRPVYRTSGNTATRLEHRETTVGRPCTNLHKPLGKQKRAGRAGLEGSRGEKAAAEEGRRHEGNSGTEEW
jgi:hypothetical protein